MMRVLPSSRRATVVCVLGMHRSGTSLIARMVNLLGVDFGPQERMLPPQPDNPKGFWEYIPFVMLNERILDRYGGRWQAPPDLPPRWWRGVRSLDLRLRARYYARQDFRHSRLWGWKDPRACLTLPFWRHLYPQMNVVVCFRNPIDAAASLERREGIPLEQGLRLWELYSRGALEHSVGCPRVVVSYEEALAEPAEILARIARLILPEADGDRVAPAAARLEEAVDGGGRHHATPASDVLESEATTEAVRDLYGELLERRVVPAILHSGSR
jgi:hypothetical protein